MTQIQHRRREIEQIVVTAQQMRDIEARTFDFGMPVAALMEKGGTVVLLKGAKTAITTVVKLTLQM